MRDVLHCDWFALNSQKKSCTAIIAPHRDYTQTQQFHTQQFKWRHHARTQVRGYKIVLCGLLVVNNLGHSADGEARGGKSSLSSNEQLTTASTTRLNGRQNGLVGKNRQVLITWCLLAWMVMANPVVAEAMKLPPADVRSSIQPRAAISVDPPKLTMRLYTALMKRI